MECHDSHVHASVADVFQAGCAQDVGEAVGVREAVNGLGEVGVRGAVSGHQVPEEGDEAPDVNFQEEVERRPAFDRAEVYDCNSASRLEHADDFRDAGLDVFDVSEGESGSYGDEGLVGEGEGKSVGLEEGNGSVGKPLGGLASGYVDHRTARDLCPRLK